jgi:hypothetical protein
MSYFVYRDPRGASGAAYCRCVPPLPSRCVAAAGAVWPCWRCHPPLLLAHLSVIMYAQHTRPMCAG